MVVFEIGLIVEFKNWYWYACSGVMTAYVLLWISQLAKIIFSKPGEFRVPHLMAFNIISMASIASFTSLIWDWGGLCVDTLK